jgi:hypothetical protein
MDNIGHTRHKTKRISMCLDCSFFLSCVLCAQYYPCVWIVHSFCLVSCVPTIIHVSGLFILFVLCLGTQDTRQKEWTIQTHGKYWAHKTQDTKNEQSRHMDNSGHTRHRTKANKNIKNTTLKKKCVKCVDSTMSIDNFLLSEWRPFWVIFTIYSSINVKTGTGYHTRHKTKRMNNPDTWIILGTQDTRQKEWTIQTHGKYWAHKTQDTKNEQSRHMDNSGHTRHRV